MLKNSANLIDNDEIHYMQKKKYINIAINPVIKMGGRCQCDNRFMCYYISRKY